MRTPETASTQPVLAGTQARRKEGDQAAETPFAELVAALRMGYGERAIAARANAAVGGAFSPESSGDARHDRVEEMATSSRSEGREAAGRDTGLADGAQAGERGGRGQRLAVERENAAAAARAGAPSGTSTASTQSGKVTVQEPSQADSEGTPRSAGPEAMRPAVSPVARGPRQLRSNVRPDTVNVASAGKPGPVGAVTGRPQTTAAAAPKVNAAQPATLAAKATPTLARQIGQLLSARADSTGIVRQPNGTPRAGSRASAESNTASAGGKPGANTARSAATPDVLRANFDTLVRNIRMTLGSHRSTAKIRLNPPELGQVRVDVKLVDTHLELRVTAENPVAREMLGERMAALRSALLEHGVTTDRVEVVDPRAEQEAFAAWDGEQDPDGGDRTMRSEGRNNEEHGRGIWGGDQDERRLGAEEHEEQDAKPMTVLEARLDIHI